MNYEKYLESNKDKMISSLQDVLRFNSERTDKVVAADGSVYPFGIGVQQSFECTLSMAEEMGFVTKNVDNYGGHIDFPGTGKPIVGKDGTVTGYEKPEILGIIGHLDVVPAAGGWSFDPYGAEVKDGTIFGRGTSDDKGPVISCLYAMKALKEAGFAPQRTIRLIIGLDEETQWEGMDYYFSKVEKPTLGFTPDADFPIINGEMGILIFELAKKFQKTSAEGLSLRSIKGGAAANSVADSCRAVVNSANEKDYEDIKNLISEYKEATGYKVHTKGVGKSLEITTEGIGAHGAKPSAGLNAISIMMEILGKLNFANEDQMDFISFYNEYIGFCLNGEKMGIFLEDEPSGKLIFNVGKIDLDAESAILTINIRYPVTCTEEQVYEPMTAVLEKYDMGLIKGKAQAPIYMDLNSPIIKTLVEIYRKHTGDTESEPLVIGGGTYARAAENIVAYGAAFPGDEELMHQKDECLTIERLEQMTRIYAEAIYKLSSGEYNV